MQRPNGTPETCVVRLITQRQPDTVGRHPQLTPTGLDNMTRYQKCVRYLPRWKTVSDNCAPSSKQRVAAELVDGEADCHA